MKQVLVKRGKVQVKDVSPPLVEKSNVLIEIGHSLISTGSDVTGIRQSSEPLIRKATKRSDQVKKLLGILTERGIKKTLALVESKINSGYPAGYSFSVVVVQVGEGVEELNPETVLWVLGRARQTMQKWFLCLRTWLSKFIMAWVLKTFHRCTTRRCNDGPARDC